MAWECDLRTLEEDLRRRNEQVQLSLIDDARHKEVKATREQCLEEELGTIPACEQSLAAHLVELEEGRARLRQQEATLQEREWRL